MHSNKHEQESTSKLKKIIDIPYDTNLNEITEQTAENQDETKPKGQLEIKLMECGNFRYNTVTGRSEYFANKTWGPLTDFYLNSITRALKNEDIKGAVKTNIKDLLESDFVPKVNPLEKYFAKLPVPQGDPIGELLDTLSIVTPEHKDLTFRLFRKWLVGVVANVFIKERRANHLCPIIVGRQGTFKSTFIRLLCPAALDQYYVDGGFDPENKDSIIRATQAVIYNVDDYFADITGKKANALKGFLTQPYADVRTPYGIYSEKRKIYASFIGSSNEATFLHDPTGNRRFLPIEVNTIDIEKAQAIDINQVWAQAYQLFKNGYEYWLTNIDQKQLEKYNGQFEVQTAEYESLNRYFRPLASGDMEDQDTYKTTTDILRTLKELTGLRLGQKKMGEALRKSNFMMTWKRRGKTRGRYWAVTRLDPERDGFEDEEG